MNIIKFGEILREFRKNRLNITQQGLSFRLNTKNAEVLSISTISRLENGKEDVTLDRNTFLVMCKMFAGYSTPEKMQRWAGYRGFKLSIEMTPLK